MESRTDFLIKTCRIVTCRKLSDTLVRELGTALQVSIAYSQPAIRDIYVYDKDCNSTKY